MGGKQIFKGYKSIVYITGVIFLIILIAGCIQTTPPAAPKPSLLKKKGMNHLSIAEEYIVRKDFEAALSENNLAFDVLRYETLFQKGIIYAHPNNPLKNYDKAYNYTNVIVKNKKDVPLTLFNNSLILSSLFKQLIEKDKTIEQLKAQCQDEKQRVATLQEKTNELESQIEHLKEVDLKIEEKKRKSLLNLNTQGSEN